MARAVLQAIDVAVGEGSAEPFSFDLRSGEIHALLVPPDAEQARLLRVLAGLEPPRTGRVVLPSGPMRAEIATNRRRASASRPPPDIVLIGLEASPANDPWDWIVRQREHGCAVVVATPRHDDAYRSDGFSLALWSDIQLRGEFDFLSSRMVAMNAMSRELASQLVEDRVLEAAMRCGEDD